MSAAVPFETLPCCVCHKTSTIEVDPVKLTRWQLGEHVQDVWPEMSVDERELLITGTHGKCWDELFADDEDESEDVA